mmetsp:Transcript_68424/g.135568  ORF Transcript_68424/g.135568 Transcript_68424/m.135568 type:complete len:223 (-) Transcript_68424:43-711(-)
MATLVHAVAAGAPAGPSFGAWSCSRANSSSTPIDESTCRSLEYEKALLGCAEVESAERAARTAESEPPTTPCSDISRRSVGTARGGEDSGRESLAHHARSYHSSIAGTVLLALDGFARLLRRARTRRDGRPPGGRISRASTLSSRGVVQMTTVWGPSSAADLVTRSSPSSCWARRCSSSNPTASPAHQTRDSQCEAARGCEALAPMRRAHHAGQRPLVAPYH